MLEIRAVTPLGADAIGEVTASPTANTLLDRLKTVNTTLGTPMQATGGTVGIVAGSALIGAVDVRASGTVIVSSDGNNDGQAAGTVGLRTSGYDSVFNGTTWDRQRGDKAGTVSQPHAMTADRWTYAAAASGIVNTTTAVTFIAAHASLRNYVTSIQIMAEALTNATELAIRDGAGGTVLWRTKIGTGGLTTGQPIVFPVPLKGTAATLLEVVTLTASGAGAVYFNAQGFVAA